jgi:signal transduction histidine kinase
MRFVAEGEQVRLPQEIATACFRVAQESLANAMRHSQARYVLVQVDFPEGNLELHVTDDGKGFDPEATRSGALAGKSIGLLSMEERATLLGGHCEIVSSPGRGTTVVAKFPITGASDPSVGKGSLVLGKGEFK